MRYLVVCCDGTWNTPEQESVTNVFRIHNALAEKTAGGIDQIPYYQAGVGTGSGVSDWLRGGIAGFGLAANVKAAYHWVTMTYRPGDRIALFGFSRGAYTVRSLAGMIRYCGLFRTTGLCDTQTRMRIDKAFDKGYRAAGKRGRAWRDGLDFLFDPDNEADIPVHFIGVWDTVGALGIPDNLGLLNLADLRSRYAFLDNKLNPHIRHARQALAMDEMRGPFTPSVWDEGAAAADQDVKQVWFPGSHMDVGGGHVDTGLSDGALEWMIHEAESAEGIELAFPKKMKDQVKPDPRGVVHDDDRSAVRLLAPLYEPLIGHLTQPIFELRPRRVPRVDAHDLRLHRSVYERQQAEIITTRPYRPTTTLRPRGGSATVTVLADRPWNNTGIYLEPGTYEFAAEGEWQDADIWSGPAGITGLSRYNPFTEGLRLVGTALAPVEAAVRFTFRNPRANLILTRREEDLPWMSLVGVIANENGESVSDDGPKRHQRLTLGAGAVTVDEGGYLYAFANDAWGFYWNNRGSIRLTVTRTR